MSSFSIYANDSLKGLMRTSLVPFLAYLIGFPYPFGFSTIFLICFFTFSLSFLSFIFLSCKAFQEFFTVFFLEFSLFVFFHASPVLFANSKSSLKFSSISLTLFKINLFSFFIMTNSSPTSIPFLISAGITICPFELILVIAICIVRHILLI